MKKLITLVLIAFAFIFSVQDVNAQQRPEEVAKLKVAELSQTLDLTGDQQRSLWRVMVKKESALAKAGESTQEIESTFDKEIKEILTPEQYQKYLTTIEK
ncbi:MAG: hypothetical protein NXH73_08310 [Flavobacteriaceae bacterium]|nr:hypothetical protein [Flavobacteriaceae bacterium]